MESVRRVDEITSVPAVRLESFAEVLATEALVRLCKAPAGTINGLHLKVGTAMI
jgi:hypothetical protein